MKYYMSFCHAYALVQKSFKEGRAEEGSLPQTLYNVQSLSLLDDFHTLSRMEKC